MASIAWLYLGVLTELTIGLKANMLTDSQRSAPSNELLPKGLLGVRRIYITLVHCVMPRIVPIISSMKERHVI